MALRIKLKNSVVQDRVPTTSDLPEVGELAVNANINSIGGFMRASDNSVVKIFGPGSLSTPTATTSVSGISELATNSETTTGTATDRVVTPAGLNAVTVAERSTSNSTYLALAGGTLTGVLTATAGSNSAPSIHFGDSDSGIFGGTNTVSLTAGGTTRLTADTGVSVVGTLAVTGAITSTSDLTIAQKLIHAGDTDTFLELLTDTICFDTAGSEAIRVDSSQRLLVGTSSSRTVGSRTPSFQIEGSNNGRTSLSVTRNSADNAGSSLVLAKSRGTSNGSSTIINDDDQLGVIRFIGADGTDVNTQAAQIAAFVDGTPGSNDMPGRLVFSTTADGDSSPTTRMTIKADGKIGIGTTSPINNLHVHQNDSDKSILQFTNTTTGTASTNGLHVGHQATEDVVFWNHEDTDIKIATNNTERIRIKNDALVGINVDDPLELVHMKGNLYITLNGSTVNDGNGIKFQSKTGGFTSSYGAAIFGKRVGDTSSYLRFDTGGQSEKMRLTEAGRLGIGKQTPSTPLHVRSADNVLATFESSDADALIEFYDNSSSDTIVMGALGGDDLLLRCDAGNIVFHVANNNERLRIASGGGILIGSGNQTKTQDGVMIERNSGDGTAHITAGRSGGNYSGMNFYVAGASGVTLRHQVDYQSNFKWFAADGTTVRQHITSTGAVTKQAQPFVHILGITNTGGSGDANNGTATTYGPITYSAGRVTVQVEGNYLINFNTISPSGTGRIDAFIKVNGNNIVNMLTADNGSGYRQKNGSIVYHLSVNDYIDFNNSSWYSASSTGTSWKTASVYLLG